MILGQTYDEQLFKSEMFRLFIDTFADNQNGIINNYKQSCVLSNTQSTITVADGAFLMQGGLIQIQGNETVEVELDNTCCILAFEIDLTQENTETEFNQGKFKVIKGTGTSYPTLQQSYRIISKEASLALNNPTDDNLVIITGQFGILQNLEGYLKQEDKIPLEILMEMNARTIKGIKESEKVFKKINNISVK